VNTKTYEAEDGSNKVGIFITVGMSYDIDCSLAELELAGVDIGGMYAVRRVPQPGQRRLIGRVGKMNGPTVTLLETTDAPSMASDQVKLEGSKENFSKCLKTLLG